MGLDTLSRPSWVDVQGLAGFLKGDQTLPAKQPVLGCDLLLGLYLAEAGRPACCGGRLHNEHGTDCPVRSRNLVAVSLAQFKVNDLVNHRLIAVVHDNP
jgi:hypothetical protein